jgi:hypothetical protein
MEECPLTVKNEIEKEGLAYPNCKTMSNGIKPRKGACPAFSFSSV